MTPRFPADFVGQQVRQRRYALALAASLEAVTGQSSHRLGLRIDVDRRAGHFDSARHQSESTKSHASSDDDEDERRHPEGHPHHSRAKSLLLLARVVVVLRHRSISIGRGVLDANSARFRVVQEGCWLLLDERFGSDSEVFFLC